jgi:neopullulanase
VKRQFILSLIFSCFFTNLAFTQVPQFKRVDPTNWYVGMKNPKLQLLVYGVNIGDCAASINYEGVSLLKTNKIENPNYLFLDLEISPNTKPGNFSIDLSKTVSVAKGKGKKKKMVDEIVNLKIPYELKTRTAKPQKVTSADFIYLLLPDRFSNGDPTNDKFTTMADTVCDRKNPFARHGGDLQGITNHLDYIKELGATTLWLNPVTENDQPQTNEGGNMRSAYHGYGFTDHYNVDRRLGGNAAYLKMVNEAHAKGLKVIEDNVYNHVGKNHWFLRDMPMKNWLNQWDKYTNTTYRDEPKLDPYASKADKDEMEKGWFVPFLPDLNQKNEYVSNYLIQNALWKVEYFNLDGWRIDTYQYNDNDFLKKSNEALYAEYPDMFITAENAVHNVPTQAYYTFNNLKNDFVGNVTSANDFNLAEATIQAVNEKLDWGKGFNKVYGVLAQDLLYKYPERTMTFLDNHDHDRFYSQVGEDFNKYKLALTFLLTTRGIPQLYYGTENLTKNFKNPSDAEVRKDFEGGFPGDPVNKFLATGRTAKENEAFNFVKKLANYRKNTPALHSGTLLQYLPKEGFYVYFRKNNEKTVMIILSQNAETRKLNLARFSEGIGSYITGYDILTERSFDMKNELEVPGMGQMVLELR